MSGWIKLEKDLLTDPRLIRLSRAIGLCNGQPLQGVTLVLGALAQLWMIADSHIQDDGVVPIGAEEFNQLIGVKDFCNHVPRDWLEILDSNSMKLPNYHQHNGSIAKERAQIAKRVTAHRYSTKLSTVTPSNGTALPDQTRLDQTKSLKTEAPKMAQGDSEARRDARKRLSAILPKLEVDSTGEEIPF